MNEIDASRRGTRRALVALLSLLVAHSLLPGCGRAPRPDERRHRPRVRIAAASDLNAALADLTAGFSATHGVDIAVSYGSSGTFYAQLVNRAPFDMFLSADVAYPTKLTAQGLTVPGSEFTYGTGRIVIWTSAESTLDVEDVGMDALTSPAVTHIAIANPDHAPYGRAAVAAMTTSGIYDAIKSKLVFGDSVAQAMQFVESGSADVGIVALSLAVAPASRTKGRWFEVPPKDYPAIRQGGVILRWASDVEAARAVRAYILSDAGRSVLEQYGFSAEQP